MASTTLSPARETAAQTTTEGVSIVIPAYNEAGVIQQTVEQVRSMAAAAGVDAEIIVVDDGSGDDTSLLADREGARTVRHPHNVGYGRSLKDGIVAASNDTIVITDADGTYPIDTIPRLLAEYRSGYDMVVGARTGHVYHGPLPKRLLRWVLKLLVEFTAGRRIPDVNSGLRVFSRSMAIPYFPHLCDGFSFTTSITLAYMMTSKFVTYLEVPYHDRVGKTKVRLLRDAMRTMQFIVEAIVYYNPIKVFILISLLSGVLAAVAFAFGFGFHVLGLQVLGAVLALGVVLVFCLGLIAVLLKQIMDKAPGPSAMRG